MTVSFKDFGEVSEIIDDIKQKAFNKTLSNESEAQTRFDVIDRLIREVLQWRYGQISVEEYKHEIKGYLDYKLISGDYKIIIEAKKIGASFPSFTAKKKLKLTGTVLSSAEINLAIDQAYEYAKCENADIVIITNGDCWCYFPYNEKKENIYASLLFPLKNSNDVINLYNLFGCKNVENNSLQNITNIPPQPEEKRLLDIVVDADARLERNNIADYITPALDNALYNETLFEDPKKLERCFVSTEGRTKFDKTLNIHLKDYKPVEVLTAKRIKKGKKNQGLEKIVGNKIISKNPPVTLLIGTVGAGKSTYLKHFELVGGKDVLSKNECHWVYIDFEEMGINGEPRTFIYEKLREYLLDEHPKNPTDYTNLIEPAYENEVNALKRGPLALRAKNDPDLFNSKVSELIEKDYDKVEPYVDKLFKYLSSRKLCVIVLDNIDLYEDEVLETKVFSEGVAISKKIHCNIIISLRDSTYAKHRNDSIFNAYELKKLWLDPPPFNSVLSKRLNYAQTILNNRSAEVPLGKSFILQISDLGVFFDIVQKSLLDPQGDKFIEYMSDKNIRKGISLVRNFLTSGHINADKALQNYIDGDATYKFPNHEIFKGSILSQWKHYKENRAEALNLFNSNLGSQNLQLIKLHILKYLYNNARNEKTTEVSVVKIIDLFSQLGISADSICYLLQELYTNFLIKSTKANSITEDSSVYITFSGGYYITNLVYKLVYTESIMYDTPIYDQELWAILESLTRQIESEHDRYQKMILRGERLENLFKYLTSIENNSIKKNDNLSSLAMLGTIKDCVLSEVKRAIDKIAYWNRRG
jgi:hypothetical protein